LSQLVATSSAPIVKHRRKRILLMNVFFPPQAIGGATRVVSDLVSGLQAIYGDEYELAVLCGNEQDVPTCQLAAYSWHGVAVWSISAPHRPFMDWLHEDPALAPLVDQVLSAFAPDLVHVHCIQRLTLTSLRCVQSRGIPYVVTVHDAWWISDHQFLMDYNDRLCMPGSTEEYETASNPHDRSASGARRLALRQVLLHAAAVTAVSASFAKLYQDAGIPVITIANGVPQLPPLQPEKAHENVVRVGHIGGATHHKGFFLLKQAISRGRYDKVRVFALDHALSPGEFRRERWGCSDVTVMGRVEQERVGWLYGQFDVLAAPSLWPESFGLVAREAAFYGKWVVASDRGAIGEDIVPNRNGWLIDVGDVSDLTQTLDTLQADPERYTCPPLQPRKLRSQSDMVVDVCGLYRRLLGAQRDSRASVTAARSVPSVPMEASGETAAIH
jgi:glycosyltransferase involved in cell wall biosynthesis